jgi:[FeFe] hydrogenase H-cluster maturation GTPase HydF
MRKTPKSLRLQIGIFGRVNVGKSSFLNMVAGQDVAIISPVAGTTTDVVEKTMELLPLGPVVFLDTAGIDDTSELSGARLKKTRMIFDRADVIILVTEPEIWTGYEEEIVKEASLREVPVIVAVNKTDLRFPGEKFLSAAGERASRIMQCSSIDFPKRDVYVNVLKKYLLEICPDEFLNPPPLIGDLVPPAGLAVLIVPLDLQAPKGRLILPQVQAIRDALDNDAAVLVVKEREYAHILKKLSVPPDIVVCDSQVVLKMIADTPPELKCTTFSILFSRYKGDLLESVRGVKAIERLQPGDKILIAEGCSHHAIEDDIGRVKIPRWLRQYGGIDVRVDVCAGRDYPDDLRTYKLVIHCGGCMLTRREMLFRIQKAKEEGVPVTNYGICVSYIQGVISRTLSPFPAALELFRSSFRQ